MYGISREPTEICSAGHRHRLIDMAWEDSRDNSDEHALYMQAGKKVESCSWLHEERARAGQHEAMVVVGLGIIPGPAWPEV